MSKNITCSVDSLVELLRVSERVVFLDRPTAAFRVDGKTIALEWGSGTLFRTSGNGTVYHTLEELMVAIKCGIISYVELYVYANDWMCYGSNDEDGYMVDWLNLYLEEDGEDIELIDEPLEV